MATAQRYIRRLKCRPETFPARRIIPTVEPIPALGVPDPMPCPRKE